MGTVLLGSLGSAIGGIFGPVGAILGRAVGTMAGAYVDSQIVNALTPPVRNEGPRLTTTDIQSSTEGSIIDRIYGRARATGQVIWATRFEEEVSEEKSGGKGGGGPTVVNTTYAYFGNFAVGLCEGPIAGIGRIWADGKELDQPEFDIRAYFGDETQEADPLIEAKEGDAPAYRGLAYVVFERLPLDAFGNRLPQISVEVFRPTGDLEALVQGVAIIGGNEFGYDTKAVKQTGDDGGVPDNRHTMIGATDWAVSLDRLQMLAPNVRSVMLVVPWFGDDLRCGTCKVRPKVDSDIKKTKPYSWRVSELTRGAAQVTSTVDGTPAYGGTPSDESVIRAIQDLKARGLDVTFCPFLMMDIPAGNSLPNPYSNGAAAAGQPTYPWRGRITASPAPGFTGTADKTAATASQVAAFIGTAAPSHFGGSGTSGSYSGPSEWSYRRMVLHCAKLAALAGGVEAFLIGSEMIGLTQARSDGSTYPFVAALKVLAADVSTMLGSAVKVGYAADWSEYHSHRPSDGSGDVFFNLDPLWSDANIDFVGIDCYFPLADWRDGSAHLDFKPEGPTTTYDLDYLASQMAGGEYFDWYYASPAARDTQTRTPIADTSKGKHWVFRQKDLRGWWTNGHYNRPGGVESASATAWSNQSKPIRLVEIGCPAIDKGANQPNVFVDPKSAESAYPHYSNRARDDAMQRAYL
jgi:hypothetical protein